MAYGYYGCSMPPGACHCPQDVRHKCAAGVWVKCEKCDGAGWLRWDELDDYDGPALKGGFDDTRYSCDARCRETASHTAGQPLERGE